LKSFEKAINKDPNYALAHAGLAVIYINAGTRGLLPPEEGWKKKAEVAARRAVEIDDTLGEAHAALGFVLLHDWYLTDSEAKYKRAVELAPNSEEVCHRYANFLETVGRKDEALIYAKRMWEINPVSVGANSFLGRALEGVGQSDLAIEQYNQALEIDPNFVPALAGLAAVYTGKGMYEQAVVEHKKAIEVDNAPQRRGQLTSLGCLYARAGKKKEAEKVLEKLKEQASKTY